MRRFQAVVVLEGTVESPTGLTDERAKALVLGLLPEHLSFLIDAHEPGHVDLASFEIRQITIES